MIINLSDPLVILVKVGSKKKEDPRYFQDGQILDIRPRSYYPTPENPGTRARNCVIETHLNYWDTRGSTDWKWPGQKVYDLKKFLVPVDSSGNLPWEVDEEIFKDDAARRRDWFIDFKWLLVNEWLTQKQYDDIYNIKVDPGYVYFDTDITSYIRHEDSTSRLDERQNMAWTGGPPRDIDGVGAGDNYIDVAEFATDVNGQTLIADAFGQLTDREGSISAAITFDCDTNGNLLKLTAKSGAEHDGTFPVGDGDGAWLNYGTGDSIIFDETTGGHLAKFEVSNIALEISGNNTGISLTDGGDGGSPGDLLVNRMLIYGNGSSIKGVEWFGSANNAMVRNSIIYGIGDGTHEGGIVLVSNVDDALIYNNTFIGCRVGIYQDDDAPAAAGTTKNNLCQDNDTDFGDDGAGFGTADRNVSEDGSEPGTNGTQADMHSVNDVFQNYGAGDFRLNPAGHGGNLAILAAGADLSLTFTDDIEGQTRSTWYIGASEIVAVGGVAPTGALYGPLVGPFGGPI